MKGRILGAKPLPTIREAFSEVRREESRKKLMMGTRPSSSILEGSSLVSRGSSPSIPEGSGFVSRGPTSTNDARQRKGRPWCDHCRRPGHTKEICWKIHGKPANWKPNREKEAQGFVVDSEGTGKTTSDPAFFSKEQVEWLQKMFSSGSSLAPVISTGSTAQKGNFLTALYSKAEDSSDWIIDFGASDHMTGDVSLLHECSPCHENYKVRIADGSLSTVTGIGKVIISERLILNSVLLVPNLSCNLLSISKITQDLNCVVNFSSTHCLFQDLDSGKMIGNAKESKGLYRIRTDDQQDTRAHHVFLSATNNSGNDEEEISKLKQVLSREFEIKDLGTLRSFLGMEVARSGRGISVSQRKYTLDLLKETRMLGCKPADTPMDPFNKVGLKKDSATVDKGRYQRLVGKLIYLSHTRPDISFAVSTALSSYVFVAANVILHATEAVQSTHLNGLLPPLTPLLTSHHHTLRGFTQLLVYQVLSKVLPPLDSSALGTMSLEKRCFVDLKSYLKDNSDCARYEVSLGQTRLFIDSSRRGIVQWEPSRLCYAAAQVPFSFGVGVYEGVLHLLGLRESMEGYLDAFNPKTSITPAGIFTSRVEDLEFECVPTSLMERVIGFLNDVRGDLRCSMAKDAASLKNEHLNIDKDPMCLKVSSKANEKELIAQQPADISLDFQKKVTLSKHEIQDTGSGSLWGNKETYKQLLDMEKEDQLLDQLLHSRSVAMEKLRAGRQDFILVASLLDRIPNLAGLARTCEVFKAASLAIADTNILHDKQFQLISVTAEKWVPIVEVPVISVKVFLEKKKQDGFSILGLEQTANSIPLDQYTFPKKTVLVLGREKEGIPVELIHILDACIEIPQSGVIRSLNVHVSGAIALWEYTRQQRTQ
ncbi:hypothetical protein RJ639_043352 [Escallonia herrerae]|uniref:tRNA (guanosine(18)-2'-O)-methyltransferase TARBP1 n=1 Tax=Escallonia herrerae TaxID=1293975 RepID=A0AA88WIT0_9ASTE|nr:hypothetical protein RJ639_043352 [Escallonia herrerae]